MRNGLTKTLAAVAVACLGYQAYAVTPVIGTIPNPIITDSGNDRGGTVVTEGTGTDLYVFRDFIDLKKYSSDDSDVGSLTWSWASATNPSHYKINGQAQLNLGGGDSPITPGASKVINSSVNLGANGVHEFDGDNNPFTPTLRDVSLSPFGGPNVNTSGDTPGQILNTEVITLFASDGTTAGIKNVTFYTAKQGTPAGGAVAEIGGIPGTGNGATGGDRLSGTAIPTPTPATGATKSFVSATNNWLTDVTGFAIGGSGTLAYSNGATGLCVVVGALGAGNVGGGIIGDWYSGFSNAGNGITLTANAVWRLRATMTTTQTTSGLVPLWDILLQNAAFDASKNITAGDLAYIGDYLFLDNIGSANAIKGPAAGINTFEIWYTPAAQETAQWNGGAAAGATTGAASGAFTTANDTNNDMSIEFRVLCSGGTGYLGELDNGTVCMTGLAVDRFDLSHTASRSNVYNLNPVVSGINGVNIKNILFSIFPTMPGVGSNNTFDSNGLTIAPLDTTNGWINELTMVRPGTFGDPSEGEVVVGSPAYGDGTAALDNYPVVWLPNTLYETRMMIDSPNAGPSVAPPDSILLGYDTETDEVFANSFQLTGLGAIGMPTTTAQQYDMFFYGENGTAAAGLTPTQATNARRLAWRFDVLNTDAYNKPNPSNVNNFGQVRIHSIAIDKVTFLGQGGSSF